MLCGLLDPPTWPPTHNGRPIQFGQPFTPRELSILLRGVPIPMEVDTEECCRCYRRHDLYRHEGRVYCGDCRYFMRHGRWPATPYSAAGRLRKKNSTVREERWGSETLNRFRRTEVVSVRHAQLLIEIENEQRAD